jgi:DNA-directed RNA polymerase specialized sigma24 family protein
VTREPRASTNVFALLERELAALSTGTARSTATRQLRHRGIDILDAESPIELVAIFHDRGDEPQERAALESLVRIAACDQVAALVVLLALRPALLRIAQRVSGSASRADDVLEVVLAHAWAVIQELRDREGDLVSALVTETWTRVRTETRREDRLSRHVVLVSEPPETEQVDADPGASVAPRRVMRIRKGELCDFDRALIVATRINEMSLREISEIMETNYHTLYRRRARAEAMLRRHLGSNGDASFAGTDAEARPW